MLFVSGPFLLTAFAFGLLGFYEGQMNRFGGTLVMIIVWGLALLFLIILFAISEDKKSERPFFLALFLFCLASIGLLVGAVEISLIGKICCPIYAIIGIVIIIFDCFIENPLSHYDTRPYCEGWD